MKICFMFFKLVILGSKSIFLVYDLKILLESYTNVPYFYDFKFNIH